MDASTNSATQATPANLMDKLKLLTNQLQSIQVHNTEFEAKDVRVYPTLCRYCDMIRATVGVLESIIFIS